LAAKKAIKALKTCHKMAPNNRDVLLGLGTFDYYTARLSGVLRFLSYLLLHKGGKEEGLRKLHLAAEEAIYSGSEAKSVLAHIYLFIEWDFPKALHLAKDLGDRYEEDPMYKLFQGVSYIWLGMDHEYRDMVRLLRQRGLEASSKEAASLWSRRALYLESTNDLFHGRYHEARLKLGAILDKSDPENDPLMIAWPIVKIGMSYDLEGNREEAEKHYHQVLNMENGSGAQFMAKRCLKRPISVRDPKIGY
jgi:tetratricopeptide (TPR) repeat protein